jgi:hypothetical protein
LHWFDRGEKTFSKYYVSPRIASCRFVLIASYHLVSPRGSSSARLYMVPLVVGGWCLECMTFQNLLALSVALLYRSPRIGIDCLITTRIASSRIASSRKASYCLKITSYRIVLCRLKWSHSRCIVSSHICSYRIVWFVSCVIRIASSPFVS